MTIRRTIAAIALALPAIGCLAEARSPESVPVDRAECARCRMLISTERGSAEIVVPGDDTRFYDDIRCLAADWPAHQRGAAAWVRVGDRWEDARDAVYARPADSTTAMGSGLVAFTTTGAARAADRDGRALTFDDVVRGYGGR